MEGSSSSTGTARLNFVRLTAATFPSTSGKDVMRIDLHQFQEGRPLYRVTLDKRSRRNRSDVPALRVSRVRDNTDVPFAIIVLNDSNPSKATIELGHGQQMKEVQIDLTPTVSASSNRRRSSSIKDPQATANVIKVSGLKLPTNPRLAFSWHLSSLESRIPSATQYAPSTSAPEISSPGDKPPAPSSSSRKVSRPKDVRALADVLHLVDQYGERYATYFDTYSRTSTYDADRLGGQPGQKQGVGETMHGYLEILSHLIDHEFTDHIVATLVAVLECHLRTVEEGKHGKGKMAGSIMATGCVVC